MIYTQTQLNQIKSRAICCLGEKGARVSKSLRQGLESYKELSFQMRKIILYIFVIEEWEQEEDGSGYENNVITLKEFNNVIEDLLSICCCKDWEIQTVIETDDYWEDGYTDNDDETSEGAYVS